MRDAPVRIVPAMTLPLTKEIEIACRRVGIAERKALAERLQVSTTHMSDLLNGRRAFTAELMKATVRELAVPKQTARRWHRIGAKAAGWDI